MCALVTGVQTCALPIYNLSGPGDGYDPEQSHVLAALIRKFHEAKLKMEKRGGASPLTPRSSPGNTPLPLTPHSSRDDVVVLWGTGTQIGRASCRERGCQYG